MTEWSLRLGQKLEALTWARAQDGTPLPAVMVEREELEAALKEIERLGSIISAAHTVFGRLKPYAKDDW